MIAPPPRALLVAAVALASGCYYPTALSPRCQEIVNECLRSCAPVADYAPSTPSPTTGHDIRSDCEKDCHRRGADCWPAK